MKTRLVLTYDHDKDPPSDQNELELAIKAQEFVNLLHEYDQWLRECLKYDAAPAEQQPGLDAARSKLYAMLGDEGLLELFDRLRW